MTVISLLLSISACSAPAITGPDEAQATAVDTVLITASTTNIPIGETLPLRAEVRDERGRARSDLAVEWASSDLSVASVSQTGAVKGLKQGKVTIRATSGNRRGRIRLDISSTDAAASLPAFPGAQGWGAQALSACDRENVEVRPVTNLADAGPGTLRAAIEGSNPSRLSIVVFDVAGYIDLESAIELRGQRCLYIAGQTAPGSGITLRGLDQGMMVLRGSGTSDIAIRYLRFRPGTGQPGVNTNSQGMIIGTGDGVIVDHVSFSWASDQLLAIYNYPHGWGAPRRISVQRTLFGEPLASSPVCYSTKGDVESGPDGIPDWYDVEDITLHHNAAVHCSHRAPMLTSRTTEVINNVVYNWNQGAMHATRKTHADFIGNYFRAGPATRLNTDFGYEISHEFSWNEKGGWTGTEPDRYVYVDGQATTWDGRAGPGYYLAGNEGPNLSGSDQWSMTSKYKNDERDGHPESDYLSVTYHSVGLMPIALNGISLRRTSQLLQPPVPVSVESASAAWRGLIEDGDVGANRRVTCRGDWVGNQDPVDRRLLSDARSGAGPSRDSYIGSQDEVGGYPAIDPGEPCRDADGDGMPDEFEARYGLDPTVPADGGLDSDGDGYTNLEEYVNGTRPN